MIEKKYINDLNALSFCKCYVYPVGHEVNFTLRELSIMRKETVPNGSSLEQIQPYRI